MTQMSAQQARALFDDEDAEQVVMFLQGEDEPGVLAIHRGYNRRNLAQMILDKTPIPMILVKEIPGWKPEYNNMDDNAIAADRFASFLEVADYVRERSAQLGIVPKMVADNPDEMTHFEFKWTREATEMEQVAAKAYMRDNPHEKKYKTFRSATLSASGGASEWLASNATSTAGTVFFNETGDRLE